MKQTCKYVFEQIWYLIILLVIAIFLTILGKEQDFMYGFFPSYMKFAIYVIVMGIVSGFLGNLLPRKFHPERYPFKNFKWENDGKIFQKKCHITRWKDKVFDISKAEVGVKKKKLNGISPAEGIERLIQETCVAEITHMVLILISPVMLFFLKPPWAVVFMAAYIGMNLMDVMIQRYNRPRLIRLHQKMLRKR